MFIENVGQFSEDARFQVRGGLGSNMWLAEDAIWLTILEPTDPDNARLPFDPERSSLHAVSEPRRGANIKLSFVGAAPNPILEPFDPVDTGVSYFLGSDPDGWRPDVPVWGGVRYVNLYPGVDLELTARKGRLVQRVMADGAVDLDAISLQIEGAEGIVLDGPGLRLSTSVGELFWLLPTVDTAVVRESIVAGSEPSTFVVSFPLRRSALTESLPRSQDADALVFSSLLGGSLTDYGYAIALDETGRTYVAGYTGSQDFPTTPGAFDVEANGSLDAFVAKVNPAGDALEYATFLGGGQGMGGDFGVGIAVDASGAAYVTGYTSSADFPTTDGAFDRTLNGIADAFVAKVTPAGSALLYATLLGGGEDDFSLSIAVDESGTAYVTGETYSADFPTTRSSFSTRQATDSDAFITALSPDGSALIYSLLIGGSDIDVGSGIALDSSGRAYVAGWSTSPDFPVSAGAFDLNCGSDGNCDHDGYTYLADGFVARANSSGSAWEYATYLGGGNRDYVRGIALDDRGAVSVVGETSSSDFPATEGAFDTSCGSDGNCDPYSPGYPRTDAFLARLAPAGNALEYATFLGGQDSDCAYGVSVSESGTAFVVGWTRSLDFATTADAFDTTLDGAVDAFVLALEPDGSSLACSTLIGGTVNEYAMALATSTYGVVYATGWTNSLDFPTTPGAFDTAFSGGIDAFVLKLALGSGPPLGSTVTLDNLYIDDAWMGGTVNRVAGDEFRVVAALSNDSSISATGIITFSLSHETGVTPWTFVGGYARPYPPAEAVTDPLSVIDLGGGRYRVSHTLAGYSRAHLVLRLRLSGWVVPQWIHAAVELGVQGQELPQQHRETAFRIVTVAPALIITNRGSLFDRYGSYGYAQVSELLGTLALISDGDANFPNEIEGLIYNVDWHLDDAAPIPEAIDALVKVTADRSGALYLMIVGGRDVVPFYPVTGELLSDGPYADTMGEDYGNGQFELATGRIIGQSPGDMKALIERGLQGPASMDNAVLASTGACIQIFPPAAELRCVNLDYAEDILDNFGIGFTPDMVASEDWSGETLIDSANADPFSFFVFGGHSQNSTNLVCPNAPDCGSTYFSPSDVSGLNLAVEQYRPIIALCGCSLGSIPDGYLDPNTNMTGAWLQKGASAVLAPTSAASIDPTCETLLGNPAVAGAELWLNNFFYWLGTESCPGQSSCSRMRTIGSAWQETSRKLVGGDSTTRLQFVLYGVPWMRPPFTTVGGQTTELGMTPAHRSIPGIPIVLEPTIVTRSLTFEVTNYEITESEDYEWIVISGTQEARQHLKPILPRWLGPAIILPADAVFESLAVVSGTHESLGSVHVPNFYASTSAYPTYPYTDTTDVSGLYPQSPSGYHLTSFADHIEIQPFLYPAQHDPGTEETLLWTHATLQLTYTLTNPVAISSFGLSADRVRPAETLQASALIHNAGASELVGLSATLVVSDVLGRWVGETDSGLFTIAAGGAHTLTLPVTAPLPDGPYHVEIRIWQASANLAHSHTFFTVSSGDILEIESPDPIWKTPGGTEVPLGLRYRSGLSTTEVATGTIRVLDAWGREVDRLNTIPLAVPPDSDRLLEAVWYFENLPTGRYMLSASVEIAGRSHGPVSRAVQVTTHEIWLPLVFKDRSP